LIPVTERILLTVREAADRLGIGRSTAYELIASGRLGTVHIGRACRVPVDAVDRFVEALRTSHLDGRIRGAALVGRRHYGDLD